jgi:hypothetical protein
LSEEKARYLSATVTGIELGTVCKKKKKKKGEAIPVKGRGGPMGCETSRLPHFPDNRITDGGEVAILTRWPPFTPKRIYGTHFC